MARIRGVRIGAQRSIARAPRQAADRCAAEQRRGMNMGNYFIRIDDATDLRRKVLESSKASLHMLRGHQELLRIRSEKHTLIRSLRRELKELTMLVNRMEDILPTLTKSEMGEWKQDAAAPAPKKKRGSRKKRTSAAPPQSRSVYVGHPDLPVLPPKPAPKLIAPKPATVPQHAVPKPEVHETELDKLHSKLSDIEKKLGNL